MVRTPGEYALMHANGLPFKNLVELIQAEALPVTLAAVARPGDTVLIGFDRTLSDEELEELREGFQDFTQATGDHIGFVEHASAMTVARPEEVAGE